MKYSLLLGKWIGIAIITPLILSLPAVADPNSPPACTIQSSSSLNFGAYNVFSIAPLNTTTTLQINCTPTENPPATTTSFSRGNSPSFYPRQMRNSQGESLNYNIFTSGNTIVLGDGTDGTETLNSNAANSEFIIEGTIPPLQDVRSDIYTDNLTIIVNF